MRFFTIADLTDIVDVRQGKERANLLVEIILIDLIHLGSDLERQPAASGNPDRYVMQYTGPAGEGRGFTAGFDPANYTTTVSGTFPTANVFFADDIHAPLESLVLRWTTRVTRFLYRLGVAAATDAGRATFFGARE